MATLQNLRPNDRARISGFAETGRAYRKKLLSMGLTPGAELTVSFVHLAWAEEGTAAHPATAQVDGITSATTCVGLRIDASNDIGSPSSSPSGVALTTIS